MAMKFTLSFPNLAKIHIFIPKKTIFLTASLIVMLIFLVPVLRRTKYFCPLKYKVGPANPVCRFSTLALKEYKTQAKLLSLELEDDFTLCQKQKKHEEQDCWKTF